MITQLAKMVVVSSVRLQIRGAGVVFAFASSLRVSFTNKALKPNKQPQKKIWSENQAVREIPAVVPVAPALVPVRSGGISGLPVLSPVVPVGVSVCRFSRRFVPVCRFHHQI